MSQPQQQEQQGQNADNNKKKSSFVSVFKWPEIKFGLEWEFDSPADFAKKQLDGEGDAQAPPEEGGDKGRPLKHSIGFTIPRAQYGFHVPVPDSPPPNGKLRGEFPALSRFSDTIFADNAGATLVPRVVIDAMGRALVENFVQPEQMFQTSKAASRVIRRAMEVEAVFLNANSSKGVIVMGANTSDLVFRLAQMCNEQWNGEGEVIVSEASHAANASPWERLKQRGITVNKWKVNKNGNDLDLHPLDALDGMLSAKTKAVTFCHANSITGDIADVKEIVKRVRAKAPNAVVVVDGSQYLAHRTVDVDDLDVDFYVYSTHKCFGPHMGIMYAKLDKLKNYEGPNHGYIQRDDQPAKTNLGTPNIEACAGRYALQDFVLRVCDFADIPRPTEPEKDANVYITHELINAVWDKFRSFEAPLAVRVREYLATQAEVTLFNPASNEASVPIISFKHSTLANEAIAEGLLKKKITCSIGMQGCMELCDVLGVETDAGSKDMGVLRLSIAHYTTRDEVAKLIMALNDIFHPPPKTN